MSGGGTDVLVVGAGPAGLSLALQAHDHGATVRVVERRAETFRPSRALIVHPRTLEVLRPLAVADALVGRGDPAPAVRLHLGRREVPVRLGPFALAGTAFPFLLFVRQAEVEAVLAAALEARGVPVERGRALAQVRWGRDGASAVLEGAGGREELECRAVAGCDGAASTVRALAGIGWRGGRYRSEVLLADLELHGGLAAGAGHAVAARSGVVFLFAQGERASWRLLATRAREAGAPAVGQAGQPAAPVPMGELQGLLDDAGVPARIERIAWSARVPLEHRLATHFRAGPLFVVGDAAHVHSPAGGQGMNTGIQDATNLGWKLAFAASAPPASAGTLLDSYERERRPADRRVLAMTHLLFWGEAGGGVAPSLVRAAIAPAAAPLVAAVLGRRRLVARAIRTLSQLDVRYPRGALCAEGSSPASLGARAGERLPDGPVEVEGRTVQLHALLARAGVHLLVGERLAGHLGPLAGPLVSVHRVAGLEGVVGVRPDGYVGFSGGSGDVDALRAWLVAAGVGHGDGAARRSPPPPPASGSRRGGDAPGVSRPG